MYAAAAAGSDMLRVLVEAKADVNALDQVLVICVPVEDGSWREWIVEDTNRNGFCCRII